MNELDIYGLLLQCRKGYYMEIVETFCINIYDVGLLHVSFYVEEPKKKVKGLHEIYQILDCLQNSQYSCSA